MYPGMVFVVADLQAALDLAAHVEPPPSRRVRSEEAAAAE